MLMAMRVLVSAGRLGPKAYRFIALRYQKKPEPKEAEEPEQYQLFETSEYTYRVFVTNMDGPIEVLVWFTPSAGQRRT
jgi:hypothetical protein